MHPGSVSRFSARLVGCLVAALLTLSACQSSTQAPALEPAAGEAAAALPASASTIGAAPAAGMPVVAQNPVQDNEDDPSSSSSPPQAQADPKVKRWSGISMANLKEPVPGLNPDQRCQISHVYRASPGDRAGALKGDMITAIDGQPVLRFQDVGRALKGKPPGSVFQLTVFRAGKSLSFPVTIEARPADMRQWQIDAWSGSRWIPFALKGFNGPFKGKKINADSLAGKVVILDFWATWCGPCQAAMPELERLEKQYGARGLVVVGISSEEAQVVKTFLERRPLSYRVALDPGGEVKQDYEISKLPTLYVIDQKGTVVEVGIGSGHVSRLDSIVKRLLG